MTSKHISHFKTDEMLHGDFNTDCKRKSNYISNIAVMLYEG